MIPEQIHLEVVTPEEAVLTEEVDEVDLPAVEGQIGVRPGHVPLLTSLNIGEMVVRSEGKERRFFVVRGFAEILSDTVRVLAQECEGVEDIDIESARADLREAERELERLEAKEPAAGEEELQERYRESLRKNRMRLMMSGDDELDE